MTRDFVSLIPTPVAQDANPDRSLQDPEQEGVGQLPMPSASLDLTPSEAADTSPLDLASHVSAPLVDQALEATRVRHNETGFAENELAALKEELLSLEAKAETFGLTIGDEAIKRVEDFSERTRATIRSRPWQSIAAAITVGFILGHRR